MMHIRISTLVRAPRAIVMSVYADYEKWPQLFSTIKAVRLLRRDGEKLILAIDHEEGPVINELLVQPPDRIDLWERKRHYEAHFRNRFDAVPDGTLFVIDGDIRLRPYVRWLQPFVRGYATRRMQRFQLLPVAQEAERQARRT